MLHHNDSAEQPPTNHTDIATLADDLADRARQDPAFAEQLRHWLDGTIADPAADDGNSGAINTINGQIHGNVVQARDITGPITFGP